MKLCVVVCLAIIAVALSACASADPNTQTHEGIDIKLLSFKRTKEFASGMQRASPTQSGYDLAVARLEFKAASSKRELKLGTEDMEVIDAQGRAYPSDSKELSFTFGDGSKPIPMDVLFAVPEDARLRRLRLGRAVFELENLPADNAANKAQ